MNRQELRERITDQFQRHLDGKTTIEELHSLVDTLVVQFCNEVLIIVDEMSAVDLVK